MLSRHDVDCTVSKLMKTWLYQILDGKKRVGDETARRDQMRADARRRLPKQRTPERFDLPAERSDHLVAEGGLNKFADDHIAKFFIFLGKAAMGSETFVKVKSSVAGFFDCNRQAVFRRKAILN